MKHPDQESWISYLYHDDLPPGRRAELESHLAACRSCRDRLASWNRVRQHLDTRRIPARTLRFPSAPNLLRLAATLMVLAAGMALGRYALADRPDLESFRVQIREELAAELRSDWQDSLSAAKAAQRADLDFLLAEFAAALEQQRRQDLGAVQQAMLQLDHQHRSDHASLRRDVETVAMLTDASFRLAHEQLVQVASVAGGSYPPINP
jgi:anti-sigma factor RsiW